MPSVPPSSHPQPTLDLSLEDQGGLSADGPGEEIVVGHIRSLNDASREDGSWVMGHVESADGSTRIAFVGEDLPGCEAGRAVRLVGEWEEHPDHGRQFRARKIQTDLPTHPEAIVRYIAQNVDCCGPARARTIVTRLGTSCLDLLSREPDRAGWLFSGKTASKVADAWRRWAEGYRQHTRSEKTAVELMSAGLSHRMAHKVQRHFRGNGMAEKVVLNHPYRLVEVRGIGFRTADDIARNMGISDTDPSRVAAGLVYSLEQAMRDGHSAVPRKRLMRRARKELGIDDNRRVAEALERSLGAGTLIEDGGLVYLPAVFHTERKLASRIAEFVSRSHPLAGDERGIVEGVLGKVGLTGAQAEAARTGLVEGLSVLTGRPGSGKTTTTRAYVRAAEALGLSVRIAAPTGKAAARAAEVTGREASTIHRLVGGRPGDVHEEPIECDVLVLDEASMIDLRVAHWCLQNVDPVRTRVLLVGDNNQLPPVGHGRFLGDVLDSGVVPAIELTEIFRQARGSRIVTNAHRLLDRKPLRLDNASPTDFLFADVTSDAVGPDGFPVFDDPDRPRREQEEALRRLDNAIEHLRVERGARPVEDIQVLSPMRKGRLGVTRLNTRLQRSLNPDGEVGPPIGGDARVRVGDRIIQTRNDYTVEGGLFNGEQGEVLAVDRRSDRLVARFEDREIELSGRQLRRLQLAWAITVHRSQGSEFPFCVLLYHTCHHALLDASLLYTALTRAEQLLVLIGNHRALDLTRRYGHRHGDRDTGLRRRIRSACRRLRSARRPRATPDDT